MDAMKVKKCSKQLKMLLEQHNALDTRVRKQIQEVIDALEAVEVEASARNRIAVILSISSLLRVATNIAEMISRILND